MDMKTLESHAELSKRITSPRGNEQTPSIAHVLLSDG